jgi:hypothetical protein
MGRLKPAPTFQNISSESLTPRARAAAVRDDSSYGAAVLRSILK